jgi:hypothetical protein
MLFAVYILVQNHSNMLYSILDQQCSRRRRVLQILSDSWASTYSIPSSKSGHLACHAWSSLSFKGKFSWMLIVRNVLSIAVLRPRPLEGVEIDAAYHHVADNQELRSLYANSRMRRTNGRCTTVQDLLGPSVASVGARAETHSNGSRRGAYSKEVLVVTGHACRCQ